MHTFLRPSYSHYHSAPSSLIPALGYCWPLTSAPNSVVHVTIISLTHLSLGIINAFTYIVSPGTICSIDSPNQTLFNYLTESFSSLVQYWLRYSRQTGCLTVSVTTLATHIRRTGCLTVTIPPLVTHIVSLVTSQSQLPCWHHTLVRLVASQSQFPRWQHTLVRLVASQSQLPRWQHTIAYVRVVHSHFIFLTFYAIS